MAYDQQVKQTINGVDVVPIVNAAQQANTTGTITTSTSVVTATNLIGVGAVTIQISGTYAGVNVTFEASVDGGANFVAFPVQPVTVNGGLITTSGAITNSTLIYDATPLLGVDQFRVRATAYTSGTANVVIHPSVQFTEPSVTVNGTIAATQSGTWTVQPGNTANTTAWLTRLSAQATGGTTPFFLISAASTNATSVKASAGTLYELSASNSGASVAYLKLFNLATAPTVGTSTPIAVYLIPAGGGTNIPLPPMGKNHSTGISYSITGGIATADTTAVAANQVVVNGSFV